MNRRAFFLTGGAGLLAAQSPQLTVGQVIERIQGIARASLLDAPGIARE